ncbi:hypothetical protein [Clostridium argentinense]|nr:hypothetical protein [Clostridium argentinense]
MKNYLLAQQVKLISLNRFFTNNAIASFYHREVTVQLKKESILNFSVFAEKCP